MMEMQCCIPSPTAVPYFAGGVQVGELGRLQFSKFRDSTAHGHDVFAINIPSQNLKAMTLCAQRRSRERACFLLENVSPNG